MNKNELIQALGLAPHPKEGGYFKRTYTSGSFVEHTAGQRPLMSSIYYLLTEDHPIGYLHKNTSDIVHCYHLGSPIRYLIISAEGNLTERILGPDVLNGHSPQLLVRGGEWKAAQLCGGEYGLISEAVSPGFDYADNTLASLSEMRGLFPALSGQVEAFIKKA